MRYDFNAVIDRRGTHCEKWDAMEGRYGVSPKNGISMWVADMEFRPPPEVNEAIRHAADHGIHGYPGDLDDYHSSIAGWMERRHDWRIEQGWIMATHGVVNAVNLLVQTFCSPGDKVVVQPPVYYPFFSAVKGNSCRLIYNNLALSGDRYEMDLEDLASRIDPGTRMLIFCSPHNPGGRVWAREELEHLAELCIDRDVIIVSDEIHHDLVYDGHTHTVLASLGPEVSSRVITCTSASKTFNLAGTMTGNVIISNDSLRRRFARHLSNCGIHVPNSFGILAATAAYDHGEPWLEELLVYLQGNQRRIRDVLSEHLPEVTCMPLEGTYLAWLDFSATGLEIEEVIWRIQEKAKLALSHGYTFGPGGESYMRLNFACPRSMLDKALGRLVNAFS